MISNLFDKIRKSEKQNKSYMELYEKMLSRQDHDKIHQIINRFIIKWFPKERSYATTDLKSKKTDSNTTDEGQSKEAVHSESKIFFKYFLRFWLKLETGEDDQKLLEDDARDDSEFEYLHMMANFDLNRGGD